MIKRVDNNGLVHLVTNIRKPRKWRRFEYLEGNGTLYIDTGFLPNTMTTDMELDGLYLCDNKVMVGSAVSTWGTAFCFSTATISNNLVPTYLLYNGAQGITSISTSARYTLSFKNTTINFNEVTSSKARVSLSIPYNIYIFGCNFKGTRNYAPSQLRVFNFKLWDNGILVRDFVPAEYNGQYGMWDLVEDKFYGNSGTGIFTVGPEMKNYDEINEVRKTNSILPAGVELYDYILSTGTLWIDTGISGYNKTSHEIKFNNQGTGFVFSNSTTLLGVKDTRYGDTALGEYIFTAEKNGSNKWVYTNQTTGTVFTNMSASGVNSSNDFLFALSQTTGNTKYISCTDLKIYYFRAFNEGILILNLLPCTYLGEPGMWDTVENKFYRNQGTGLFTLGNKITLKEYEYLLTNSTNLSIDTGILLTDNHSIAYDIIFKYENNGVRRLMGPSGSSGSYFGANSNGKYDRYSSISIGNIDHLYEEFNLITKKLVAYINDFKYRENSITAANSIGHCYIFSLNGVNNYTGAGQYFYSGKMIYDGKVIRNFVPASYNGTYGLWDKVEWKFYGNAGSGSFTLGPEKKSGTYPVSYLYDRTVYEEPDGSKWLRIVHHNGPNTRRFTSSDSFTTYIHTNEHLFFDVSWCNTFTLWELMIKLKTTNEATEQKFRWIQNYNPMTATFANVARANVTYNTSSGYTVPGGSWGGLMKINSDNTYLCGNNGTNGNWWGATGCKVLYSGGLPGWNGLMVTTGYLDLYIRIA